jgi:hypothetical protein
MTEFHRAEVFQTMLPAAGEFNDMDLTDVNDGDIDDVEG